MPASRSRLTTTSRVAVWPWALVTLVLRVKPSSVLVVTVVALPLSPFGRVQLDSRRLGQISHWRAPLARGLRDALLRAVPGQLGLAQYRRVVAPGLQLLDLLQQRPPSA